MRRIFAVIMVLVISAVMVACGQAPTPQTSAPASSEPGNAAASTPVPEKSTDDKQGKDFAIYLVKDKTAAESADADINSLQLEEQPLISDKNIRVYDWENQIIVTDKTVTEEILESIMTLEGTPLVVVAGGQRIYKCTLWSALSSIQAPENAAVLVHANGIMPPRGEEIKGLDVHIYEGESKFLVGAPKKGEDLRTDKRILDALKKVGIK